MLVQAGWAFVFALASTVIFTAILRGALLRAGKVDIPRPDRWHRTPVPRPGGPAIAATIAIGLIAFLPRPWGEPVWGLLIGGAFIFVVGLLDDFVNLINPLKLTLLIAGAAIPMLFGVSVSLLPDLVGAPLAMLWIVAITNAVNWLDNMDGLAAGVCMIASVTLVALSAGSGDLASAVASAIVAGACAGFLYFNFSPARIFMGDSGSGFLGFTLAILALWGSSLHVTNVVLAIVVPLMVLSIPIFDSAVVTVARLFNGRHLFQGGTDHPSHRLIVLGLSERQAVFYLYALSLVSAIAALIVSRQGVWIGLVVAGGLGCAFVAIGIVMTRVRVYHEVSRPSGPGMVVLWQLMHKRRLLEMLLDLVLVSLAFLGAYLLRFEGDIPAAVMRRLGQALPLVIGLKMSAIYIAGAYRRDWQYVGLLDLLPLLRGTILGSLLVVAALFFWARLIDHSRAALFIDGILTFGLLAGMRISARFMQEYFATQRVLGRKVLIAGAGQGGILLLQELRQNGSLPYRPVGFVDDDPVKQRVVIRGLPVLGSFRDIPALATQYKIEEVLVAAPSMSLEQMNRITLICGQAGITARSMRTLLEPAE